MNRKQKYDDYIKSAAWQQKRIKFIEQHPTKKCFCGKSTNLHVHHATYDRLGNEDFADLRLVCNDCHDMIHYYHRNSGIPQSLEKATDDYITMWLQGNQPIVEKVDVSWRKKAVKPKKTKQHVQKHKEGSKKKKSARQERRDKILATGRPWEKLTIKEKKIVSFSRFQDEKKQKHIKAAENLPWEKMSNAQKRATDKTRYVKERDDKKAEKDAQKLSGV